MDRSFAVLYELNEVEKREIDRIAGGRAKIEFLPAQSAPCEATENAEALLGNISALHIESASRIRWAQTSYAGVEGVIPAARKKGAILTNASGAFGEGLSEYLILYTLALQKMLPEYIGAQKEKQWKFLGPASFILGSLVTVVGLGDIGRAYARKMKALGARVRAVKREMSEKPEYVDELYLSDRLGEAISGADIVALCLPSTAATEGIMSRERLYAMKPGSILLNIGRGSAVDQGALIDALREKRIYAATDVTSPEPLDAGSPLWELGNLILTPHIAGFGSAPLTRVYVKKLFMENISAYLDGRPLESVVSFEDGY